MTNKNDYFNRCYRIDDMDMSTLADTSADDIHVTKSITVTALGIDAGEVTADLSSADSITLSVFDSSDTRYMIITRAAFKEFVDMIDDVSKE